MTHDPTDIEKWTEALIEKTISPERFQQLCSTVLNDATAMDAHVDYLFNHAALSYGIGEVFARDNSPESLLEFGVPVRNVEESREPPFPRRDFLRDGIAFSRYNKRRIGIASCLALFFLGLVGFYFFSTVSGKDQTFATIEWTSDCLWGDSMMGTRPGARLGPCVLHLNQGIASIHFDCDVRVSLEGPCVFRIEDAKQTALEMGSVIVSVESPKGKGFVVDSPEAMVKDYGTKFGLDVSEDKETAVFVFDGLVDVIQKTSSERISLQRGDSFFMKSGETNGMSAKSSHQFSTDYGRGAESCVVYASSTLQNASRRFPEGISETYMHVKLSLEEDKGSDRKALFRIDLSPWKDRQALDNVLLQLSYGPTGIGYALHVPDATFSVYGLTDESRDDWSEENMNWDSFPGNEERNRLDPTMWKKLGSFMIKQASPSGAVRIAGRELQDFLLSDTNGVVSFAVVCDTPATDIYGLVRGFANRYHPSLSPPRLLLYEERKGGDIHP